MTTFLLWSDLEATGLSTSEDEIIEAAFILTDTDLNELARWEKVFQPTMKGLERLLSNKVVREMHADNGLLNDIARVWFSLHDLRSEARDVELFGKKILQELLASADTPDDVVHLAGSGIAAFDRPLINRYMPDLGKHLHYAPIDVGVLRRTWKMWTGRDVSADNASKNHRAMSDVEGHLNEARQFRQLFQSL